MNIETVSIIQPNRKKKKLCSLLQCICQSGLIMNMAYTYSPWEYQSRASILFSCSVLGCVVSPVCIYVCHSFSWGYIMEETICLFCPDINSGYNTSEDYPSSFPFSIPASSCLGSHGVQIPFQLSSGERQGNLWAGCQSIMSPTHRQTWQMHCTYWTIINKWASHKYLGPWEKSRLQLTCNWCVMCCNVRFHLILPTPSLCKT